MIAPGEVLEPAQDVKVYSAAGTELEEATDYEVTYENNVNAGTATVLFSGIGKYTGVVKKTFKIEPIRMDADGMAVQGGGIDVDYLASGATLDKGDDSWHRHIRRNEEREFRDPAEVAEILTRYSNSDDFYATILVNSESGEIVWTANSVWSHRKMRSG